MDIASLFTTPTAPSGATAGMGTQTGDITAIMGRDEVESFNRLLKGFLDNGAAPGSPMLSLRAMAENGGNPTQLDLVQGTNQAAPDLKAETALVTGDSALSHSMRSTTPEMRWQQAGLNLLAMGQADEATPPLSDEVTSFLNDLSALMRQQGLFAAKSTSKTEEEGSDGGAVISDTKAKTADGGTVAAITPMVGVATPIPPSPPIDLKPTLSLNNAPAGEMTAPTGTAKPADLLIATPAAGGTAGGIAQPAAAPLQAGTGADATGPASGRNAAPDLSKGLALPSGTPPAAAQAAQEAAQAGQKIVSDVGADTASAQSIGDTPVPLPMPQPSITMKAGQENAARNPDGSVSSALRPAIPTGAKEPAITPRPPGTGPGNDAQMAMVEPTVSTISPPPGGAAPVSAAPTQVQTPAAVAGTPHAGSIVLPAGMQPVTNGEQVAIAKTGPVSSTTEQMAASNVTNAVAGAMTTDSAPPALPPAIGDTKPVPAPSGIAPTISGPPDAQAGQSRSDTTVHSAEPAATVTPVSIQTTRTAGMSDEPLVAEPAQPAAADRVQGAAVSKGDHAAVKTGSTKAASPAAATAQVDVDKQPADPSPSVTAAPAQQAATLTPQPANSAATASTTPVSAPHPQEVKGQVAAQQPAPQPAATTAPDNGETAAPTITASTEINRSTDTQARQPTTTAAHRVGVEVKADQTTDDGASDADTPASEAAGHKESGKPHRMLAPNHTDPETKAHPTTDMGGERVQQTATRPTTPTPTNAGTADALLTRAVGEVNSGTGDELGSEQQGTQSGAGSAGLEEATLNATADGSRIGTADFSQHLRQTSAPGAPHRPGANPPATYQVAVQMQRAVQDGNDKLSIQLRPYDLGRVDVQLEFNKDGTLRAKVTADSFQTLELLQKDSRNLENALREAGLSTDQNSLSFSLRDDGDQAQRQQQEKQQDQKSGTRFASIEVEEESPAIPAYRPILGPGRVDVRI